MKIPFAPPDITDAEINEVVDTLRSGWITTGPKTKRFEEEIALYCNTTRALCLSSATAGLELVLRLFDIGEGDEVITTPYTYAATANVILHTGAKPVFVDVKTEEFNIDAKGIADAVTDKTKAVIPVDFAGFPCDYQEIVDALRSRAHLYRPKRGTWQEKLSKPLLLADSAHGFGASYYGQKLGRVADMTVFSFHAVKNLTTAEGGAITMSDFEGVSAEEAYRHLRLLSLHGQSKDAFSKMQAGGWFYEIELPGYKCNMTDISAALGLAQLRRYDNELTPKRKRVFDCYNEAFGCVNTFIIPPFEHPHKIHSYHLYPLRLKNTDSVKRGEFIARLAEKGVSANVHFIPVVMHPAYGRLGYRAEDYPNTVRMYQNEVSLPLYSKLTDEETDYIVKSVLSID